MKDVFRPVREAFAEYHLKGVERGAQLVCYYKGKKVVDLASGIDEAHYVSPNDLFPVFSCSKVMESLCIAKLEDQGQCNYSDPIAMHWPEFG